MIYLHNRVASTVFLKRYWNLEVFINSEKDTVKLLYLKTKLNTQHHQGVTKGVNTDEEIRAVFPIDPADLIKNRVEAGDDSSDDELPENLPMAISM